MTASRTGIGEPACAAWAISALTSLGRQLPPKPQPASRNRLKGASVRLPSGPGIQRYLLRWTARITSATSIPPNAEHRLANSFAKEMEAASSAFEAYLIISAVLGFVRITSMPEKAAYNR